jgi:hypothetical protein
MLKYIITILFLSSVVANLNINLYESYAKTYLNVDGNLIPLLIPPYESVKDTGNDSGTSQTTNMMVFKPDLVNPYIINIGCLCLNRS